jgi:two-component system chemotaxis response regulator CheB
MAGSGAVDGRGLAGDAPVRPVEAIVIGASAGGVEALATVLSALPAGLPVAVFVVIHLPRHQPSLLAEIFARHCALQVREALDKEPVVPGTVYFAPPDYHLLLDKGPRLALSVDDLVNYSRPSIDVLFESAADVYRERLMGVVLTGGNQDGASGLAAVHLAGGQTVVQDPATAQMPVMPEAARRRVAAARVLSLNQIAALLRRLNEPKR